jgi:misacylated tRNA(Ala) deacylase
MNEVVQQDLAVVDSYVSMAVAEATQGLLRSRSVTPPPSSDGLKDAYTVFNSMARPQR